MYIWYVFYSVRQRVFKPITNGHESNSKIFNKEPFFFLKQLFKFNFWLFFFYLFYSICVKGSYELGTFYVIQFLSGFRKFPCMIFLSDNIELFLHLQTQEISPWIKGWNLPTRNPRIDRHATVGRPGDSIRSGRHRCLLVKPCQWQERGDVRDSDRWVGDGASHWIIRGSGIMSL